MLLFKYIWLYFSNVKEIGFILQLFVCRIITEVGHNYSDVDYLGNSKEIMHKLADCSPCKYAHKVQAPTLLLLGEKDLRVPPPQSLDYYHILKKHGVTAK